MQNVHIICLIDIFNARNDHISSQVSETHQNSARLYITIFQHFQKNLYPGADTSCMLHERLLHLTTRRIVTFTHLSIKRL